MESSSVVKMWARKDTGYCGHCKLNVSFQEVAVNGLAPAWGDVPNLNHEPAVVQQIMQCTHCFGASVYMLHYDASDNANRVADRIVTVFPAPTPRQLNEVVPEKIRSPFHEAAVCEVHGALRAASVMYRSSVEETCKDRGANDGLLYQKIEALAGLGLNRAVVADLHEARLLGNDSIHDGLVYSADEVANVAELLEEVFFALYVQPAESAAYRQRRQDRRRGVSSPATAQTLPVSGRVPVGRSGIGR